MAINVNFAGKKINKPGYYGCPWWDRIWREFKRARGYTDEQIDSFLLITDTLIRLDLHKEYLWRQRSVK